MVSDMPKLPGMSKADNTGIYDRHRVCRNCRSITENAGTVKLFHILDMYAPPVNNDRSLTVGDRIPIFLGVGGGFSLQSVQLYG